MFYPDSGYENNKRQVLYTHYDWLRNIAFLNRLSCERGDSFQGHTMCHAPEFPLMGPRNIPCSDKYLRMGSCSIPLIEVELPKSFQPLQSFIASALSEVGDYDFFHQLCENVMPLLQIVPLLRPLRAKWQNGNNEYLAKLSLTEDLAKRQVKKAYAFFLELSKDNQFLSISGFNERLKKVGDLLENRKGYYTPPEYDIAYDELCNLCSLLFKNGKGLVLQSMIKVSESPRYVNENGSYILKAIPFISHHCFGQSVLKTRSLRAEWNWKEQAPTWLIWNHLCNATWAWHTPIDIFANEKYRNETPILRRRTMRLIELQNCLREMHDLKSKI